MERDGSDDRVEGGETEVYSMGRAPLGRREMQATIGWTEGKPWEIAWGELRWEGARWKLGESCVGKERDGSDDRVEGGETVGNSLGRAPLGRSEMEATAGWTEGKPWEIGCQNVQKAPCSEHVWKLRCRKSAQSCGGKHVSKSTCTKHNMLETLWKLRCRKSAPSCGKKRVSKSKCTKHTMPGALLEAEMSIKITPLWREAHFQVKMHKAHHARSTLGS